MKYLLLCLALLATLTGALVSGCAKHPQIAPVVPTPPPAVVAPHPPTVRSYTPLVRFGFDSDSVKSKDFPRFCASLGNRPVAVFGYASAERSGKYKETASAAYNGLLATARANATAFHLRVAGCNVVEAKGVGETWKFGRTLSPNRRAIIEVKE